ncbi:MAG: hypothetical protein M0P31_13860 [Solirubrobacteraceae bacterium]|nr:hypothetical protein [Solirubrobacteraceae bacterium]
MSLLDELDPAVAVWVRATGTDVDDDAQVDRTVQHGDVRIVRRSVPRQLGPLTASQALERELFALDDPSSLTVEERRLLSMLRREASRESARRFAASGVVA